MEEAERFIDNLRALRDNARNLRSTVPIEACQPAMRKAVVVAESKMEQVYLIARRVAVALVRRHKEMWKEQNRHLAETYESFQYYQTSEGSPTTWGYSSGDEEDKPELQRQERGNPMGQAAPDEETSSRPAGDQEEGGSY